MRHGKYRLAEGLPRRSQTRAVRCEQADVAGQRPARGKKRLDAVASHSHGVIVMVLC